MGTATYVKGDKITIDYTAATGAAKTVDQVVVVGDLVGIAQTAIAAGDTGVLDIGGVYNFTKTTGAAIAAGETVDWDTSADAVEDNAITATTGDCSNFGVAIEAAAAGTSTVEVLLRPGNGTTV